MGRNAELVNRPEFRAAVEGHIALRRVGELREAVDPLMFLLSKAASYITGEVIVSDGGFRLTREFLPPWSYPAGLPIDQPAAGGD